MAQIARREEGALVVPGLAPLWDALQGIAYPLLRVVMGFVFIPHGCQKLFGWFGAPAMDQYVQSFGRMGSWSASAAWVYYIGALEVVGGIALMVGFLTRFFALQFMIFMIIAAFVAHWSLGFFWTARGFELPFSWAVICFVILIHGGGKWSIDRAMGREI
jgi:putative oxidoreductase